MSTIYIQPTIYQNITAVIDNNYSTIGGVTWSSTPSYPTNIYDPKISLRLGNLNDTFEFKIHNIANASVNTFRLQDKIYFNQLLDNASVASSNQLMVGLVKSISERIDSNGSFLTVKGVSFDEMITNGLIFSDLQNVTVFEFISYCLTSIKQRSDMFPLTWNAGNPTNKAYSGESGGDQVFNGAALPKVFGGGRISYFNKTLDTILNYFLNDAYTGDGRYYWYVNSVGELCIRKMLNIPKGTITEGTTNILSANYTVNTNEIFNAIVVQCGFDPAGNAVSAYKQNDVSVAQYGIKPYLLKTNDCNNLAQQERLVNPSKWTTTSTYPSAYPYTCSWKDVGGGTVTATTNADYVDKFRTQVKTVQAVNSANQFITAHSRGMKEITIELPPNNDWRLGDIVTLNLPSYNLNNFPIRIYGIDYSYNNTLITLKEEQLYALT